MANCGPCDLKSLDRSEEVFEGGKFRITWLITHCSDSEGSGIKTFLVL